MLFPPRCAGCQRVGAWLCSQCRARVEFIRPPVCVRCGRSIAEAVLGPVSSTQLCPVCQSTPLQIDGIRSLAYFEGPLRKTIHHFKYNNLPGLATPLGEILSQGWQVTRPPGEFIVPVPLHPNRLRERGYNQAALLARQLGERCGLPVLEGALLRVRETAPQINLNAQERQQNVRGAFRCGHYDLKGKQVLLIDDVCTTGATLEACSLALYRGQARSVWAFTLARAR